MCSLIFDGQAQFKSYVLRKIDISVKIWYVHVVVKWRGKKRLYLKEKLEREIHSRKCEWLHLLHLAKPCPAPAQAKPCLSLVWKRS